MLWGQGPEAAAGHLYLLICLLTGGLLLKGRRCATDTLEALARTYGAWQQAHTLVLASGHMWLTDRYEGAETDLAASLERQVVP